MLLTLPLVPVFMWLDRALHRGTDAKALAGIYGSCRDTSSTSSAACPTLRGFNRSRAQAGVLAGVGERYRRTTMATLRVGFLSRSVLELAATLGVALVAVTVGVRLAGGASGSRPG
jgi:ABC-type transport system involved in cytochrome bd biosynthesis fused ATPase/permease subunit